MIHLYAIIYQIIKMIYNSLLNAKQIIAVI